MLRASIDIERGIFGGPTITVDGPGGTRVFYGKESREEADRYYREQQRLENEILLRKKQSDLADMQMREIQERERRTQEEQFRQKNAPPQFGYGRMPTPTPHYDPEYLEFMRWKKERDPEYQKFKQEKEQAERARERERERISISQAAGIKYAEQAEINKSPFVMINGVKWAARNIGSRGAFASKPEDFGEYYTWEEAKKACPSGYRLPTEKEFQSLIEAGSIWTIVNGVAGRLFGTAPNQIFLPAAGNRNTDGSLFGVGTCGNYWSSTPTGSIAWGLNFNSASSGMLSSWSQSNALSVRCVAE